MADFKLFINFKTYPQGTGEKAVELAKVCEEVGARLAEDSPRSEIGAGGKSRRGFEVILIVQAVDLFRITQEVKIPVWVQHIDPQPQGQFTGWTNLEAAVEAGASGTLLNHSEHQIPPGTVEQTIARIKKPLQGKQESRSKNFETMVCCKTLGQIERLVKFRQDYIAYEISELIATSVSITDSNPKTIEHAVKICKEIPLIVGAGVHKAEDLKKAKELGAKGVLISSAVVLAENPKDKLLGLLMKLK